MDLLTNKTNKTNDRVVGIYYIKNIVTKRMYIGSSINIDSRWNQHRYQLNTNRHENHYLQHSWNKHGENNFEFGILEVVDLKKKDDILNDVNHCSLHKRVIKLIESSDDRDILYGINLAREQYYLDKYVSAGYKLYNICYSAVGGNHDELTRGRISVAMTGKTSHLKGKKREDISGENNVHYDGTIRRFVNIKTGEIYEGTKYNFSKYINVRVSYVSMLVKNKIKFINREWAIEGSKLERKVGSGRKKVIISDNVYKFTCIDNRNIIESKYYELEIPPYIFKKMLSGDIVRYKNYTLLSSSEYDVVMRNNHLKKVVHLNKIRQNLNSIRDKEAFLDKINSKCKRYNFLNIKTGEIFHGTTIEFKRKYKLDKFKICHKLSSCGWTVKFNSVDEYNVELMKNKKSGTIKMRNTLHGGNHPSIDETKYELINLITGEEFVGRRYDFKLKYNYVSDSVNYIFQNKKNGSYDGWILKSNLHKHINKSIYKIFELKNINTKEQYKCNFHQFTKRFNIGKNDYGHVYRFFNKKSKNYGEWVFLENYDVFLKEVIMVDIEFDIKNIKTGEVIKMNRDMFCKKHNYNIKKTYTFFVTKKIILFDDQWILIENEHLLNNHCGKDRIVYKFKNKVTGEIFEGTRSELRKKYKNLTIFGLYSLITKRINSHHNWIICK